MLLSQVQTNSKLPTRPNAGVQQPLDYASVRVAGQDDNPVFYGLPLTAWVKIGVVTLLMCLTFRFNLVRLWLKTNPYSGEPNWRHAICVPLIGIYYLYVNRDDIVKAPVSTAWSGLGILVFGILVFVYGIYPGQNDFVKDLGMVTALFGVVALLAGWKVIRLTWFPIVFLVCALPWPELVYSKVAWPLQRLAASVAVGTLRYTGVDAFNTGTKIMISHPGRPDRTLNVAEACAGLRSLMTFISVAGAVAFLSVRPMWQKLVITASAVPIAVFCNVMRVSGQGLLDHYWSEELAEGFAHQFVGIVMLVPGFFLILLTGWMIDKVFIEEAEDRKTSKKKDVLRPASAKPKGWTLPAENLVPREPSTTTAVVATPPRPAMQTVRKPAAPSPSRPAHNPIRGGVVQTPPPRRPLTGLVPPRAPVNGAPSSTGFGPGPESGPTLPGSVSQRVPPRPVSKIPVAPQRPPIIPPFGSRPAENA